MWDSMPLLGQARDEIMAHGCTLLLLLLHAIPLKSHCNTVRTTIQTEHILTDWFPLLQQR